MTFTLQVSLDDRLRLAGALLAAGEWPDREQALKPYKPHRVAEGARRHFAPFRQHPAVQAAQAAAGQPDGPEAGRLLAGAWSGTWPAGLDAALPDFVAAAQPADFWTQTQADWLAAEAELRAVLARADMAGFLDELFDSAAATLTLFPNLLYPGRHSLAAPLPGGVLLSQPPPVAWGTSSPWRYDERPDEVLAAVAGALAATLFDQALPAEHAGLRPHTATLGLAAAALFLRRAEGPAAADQFLLMEKRTRGLPQLPAVVGILERSRGVKRSLEALSVLLS